MFKIYLDFEGIGWYKADMNEEQVARIAKEPVEVIRELVTDKDIRPTDFGTEDDCDAGIWLAANELDTYWNHMDSVPEQHPSLLLHIEVDEVEWNEYSRTPDTLKRIISSMSNS